MLKYKTRCAVLSALFLVVSYHSCVSGQTLLSREDPAEVKNIVSNLNTSKDGLVVINLFYNRLDFKALHRLIYTTTTYMREGYSDFLVVINSSGGNLNAGIAAYNYLSSLPITLRTHNISNVSSAAVMIYCAGNIRTASNHSRFLIHNGTISIGNNQTIQEVAGSFDSFKLQLEDAQSIVSRCLDSRQVDVQKIFDTETVWSASEANKFGLVHNVQELGPMIDRSVLTIPIGSEKWPDDFQ